MYENTGTRAHVMAAELIDGRRRRARDLQAPVRGHPLRQARAAGPRPRPRRALRRRAPHAELATCRPRTSTRPAPRRTTPRASSTTCARSRAPRSPRSCATASDPRNQGMRKVSLRASDDRVDVSRIARAQGGGGHRQAAGFSTELAWPELVAFLRAQVAEQLQTGADSRPGVKLVATPERGKSSPGLDGVILVDKPAGKTSHDVVAAVRRSLGVRRVGHAGTLDPFATGLLLVLVGRATRAQRFLHGRCPRPTSPSRAWARSRPPATPRARSPRPAGSPTRDVAAAHRPHPPAPAGLQRGQGRGRARLPPRAPGRGGRAARARGRRPPLRAPGATDRFEIECSSGTYVRSLIADLGDAYCLELRRTRIGPFGVRGRRPRPRRAAGRGAGVPARGAAGRRRGAARRARANRSTTLKGV